MNIDADALEPLLQRLSTIVGGFDAAQIANIVRVGEGLELDAQKNMSIRVSWQGSPALLGIRIFRDDDDALDVYFFAPEGLRDAIETRLSDFADGNDLN